MNVQHILQKILQILSPCAARRCAMQSESCLGAKPRRDFDKLDQFGAVHEVEDLELDMLFLALDLRPRRIRKFTPVGVDKPRNGGIDYRVESEGAVRDFLFCPCQPCRTFPF
jgi:hypothetical protein